MLSAITPIEHYMKINFLGRYQQVSDYIQRQPNSYIDTSKVAEFSETLQDFAPNYLQSAEKNQEKLVPAPSIITHTNDIQARLNLSSPTLDRLNIEQIDLSALDSYQDKELEESVKTPTVISIERKSADRVEVQNIANQNIAKVQGMVSSAGEKFGVDPVLGMAVVARESSFNPKAVSSDGHESKGLFQLLDRTGKDLLNRLGLEKEYNPFDPEQNVYLGVGYLKHLHDIFSKETLLNNKTKTVVAANNSSLEKLAVAAFNAGEGRVASAQQRASREGKDPSRYDHIENYLPESTQQYVAKVIEAKAQFSSALSTPRTLR
jgi:Transglycosylase SLT domain